MQSWPFSEHGGAGGVQTPPVHVSVGLQHGSVAQERYVSAHVEVPPLEQVPLVEPAGMSQVSPEQQSVGTEHVAPLGWHTVRQKPPSQTPEQQLEAVVQAFPFGWQDWPQIPERQEPKQQAGLAPPQAAPSTAHGSAGGSGAEHAQPSSVTHRHCEPSQHSPCTGVYPAAGAGAVEHIAPRGRQVVAQRRTPTSSAMHGVPPQH